MIKLLNIKCNYAPQLKIANAMNYEMRALVYETTMKIANAMNYEMRALVYETTMQNKPILYKKQPKAIEYNKIQMLN